MKITWTRTKLYHLAAVILGIGSVGQGAMAQNSLKTSNSKGKSSQGSSTSQGNSGDTTRIQNGGKIYTVTQSPALDADLFTVVSTYPIQTGEYKGQYKVLTQSAKSGSTSMPEQKVVRVSAAVGATLKPGDDLHVSDSYASTYEVTPDMRTHLNTLSKSKLAGDSEKSKAATQRLSEMNTQDKAMAQTKAFEAQLNDKEKAFNTMQKQQSSQFDTLKKKAFESDPALTRDRLRYDDFKKQTGSEYATAEEAYNTKYYISKYFVSFKKSSQYKKNLSDIYKQYEKDSSAFGKKWLRYENAFNTSQNADQKRFDNEKKILEDQLKATNDMNSLSWEALDTKNYTNGSQFIEFGKEYVYQQEITEKKYSKDLRNYENRSRSSSNATDSETDSETDSDAGVPVGE